MIVDVLTRKVGVWSLRDDAAVKPAVFFHMATEAWHSKGQGRFRSGAVWCCQSNMMFDTFLRWFQNWAVRFDSHLLTVHLTFSSWCQEKQRSELSSRLMLRTVQAMNHFELLSPSTQTSRQRWAQISSIIKVNDSSTKLYWIILVNSYTYNYTLVILQGFHVPCDN